MQRGRSPVSLSDLVEAQLLRPGELVSFRRSATITGEVTSSGTLRMSEKEHASPSTAAKAAAGGTATNGWFAWFVKRGDEWSILAELRD